MKIISVPDLSLIIQKHGMMPFFKDMIDYLRNDLKRWNDFEKCPRPAFHVPGGVIELMPIRDGDYFSFKYVNGHPGNPSQDKHTVVAVGQLSDVATGYPVMISEMTFLTAFRTAATAALATEYLSRQESLKIALIGTGAQAEFQAIAQMCVRPIKEIYYFDLDSKAMDKFSHNMGKYDVNLIPCTSVEEAVLHADIVITCTAKKAHVDVLKGVKKGTHINAMGGDCPGKTEIARNLLCQSKIFVEYLPQTLIEGEIQQLNQDKVKEHVVGELWEIICGEKKGRTQDEDITLFDCVGFAIEDFSALRLVHDLSHQYGVGQNTELLPPHSDPKDLFSLIVGSS